MIAALYVLKDGPYFGLDGIDPWDEERDARLYDGPHPVIAHPPCERWGRYWSGGPSARVRRKLGDDNGCFAAAFAAVNKWGGVLEHPEASHAWRAFGIERPHHSGGWIRSGPGWTCCVEQGHYGHLARKKTWLYYVGPQPPELVWGPSEARVRLDAGFHSAEERRRATKRGAIERLTKRQRAETPVPFRDLLIDLVRNARDPEEATSAGTCLAGGPLPG